MSRTVGGAVIFVTAFLARLVPMIRGGGLTGLMDYDDGVNFGGALGLVHGLLPYRDFLWLHPPGIQLALAPFAGASYVIGEPASLVAARIAWMLLGSATAVLIARYLLPLGGLGALFGGLLYALFWPALVVTQTVRLEGLSSFLLLIALLLLMPVSSGRAPSPRVSTTTVIVAGALLGACVTVKVWGVVTVLVLVGWWWAREGTRRALQLLLGAVLACVVICLPFFLAAPVAMWRMIVLDQIGRPRGDDLGHRLAQILSISPVADGWSVVLVLGLVLVVAAAVLAWGSARSRPAVLLLAAYTALLAAAPTWYLHYAGLTAPVLAIVLGASVQRLVALPAIRRRPRRRIVATAASLAILALPLAFVTTLSPGQPFPAVRFRAAVAGSPGCVTSDHPTALILTDSIGRNIERGCPLVIDLGGYSHDFSRGQDVSRRTNQAFQDFALSYLRTGSRAILARFSGTVGWSRKSYREIQSWPVVVQSGELSVRVPR